MSARLAIALAAALSLADLSVVASKTPTLDYEFFKTKVEPIFLKKREGHTPLLCLPRGKQQLLSAGEIARGSGFLDRGTVAQEL